MLTAEDIEERLRLWGRIFGEKTGRDDHEDSSGTMRGCLSNVTGGLHIGYGAIARTKRKVREYLDKDGKLRTEIAPESRVTGKETRTTSDIWNPPRELMEVEEGAIDLYHYDKLRGVVLRVEYCVRFRRQREKAVMVGQFEGINQRVTLRQYRHELECARVYMASWIRNRYRSDPANFFEMLGVGVTNAHENAKKPAT